MEASVEILAAVCFVLIGLSHMAQPRAWVEFFIAVRERGRTGSFINAFIHFPLGALIVAFHNVWSGLPVVLTLVGWGLVIKGLLYFTLPDFGLKRGLGIVSVERARGFVVAGAFAVAFGALCAYMALRR